MSDERTEVEVTRSGIKFAGKDITTACIVGSFFAILGVGYLVWDHKAEAKEQNVTLTQAVGALVKAQRENNCIAAFRRERDQTPEALLQFCKRFAE